MKPEKILLLLLSLQTISLAENTAPLAQAEAAYAKREDIPEAKIAMVSYERSASIEGYWKASRAAWWVAEHTENHKERLDFYQRGMTDAQKALAQDAGAVAAHFWLGVNEGSYGDTKGVLKSLSLVKPIRHEMQEVIRLDEHFSDGGAWRVLGVVDYKVPGLMGGSKSRAKEELQKALAFGPNNPFNHYFMAEYEKTVGEKEKKEAEIRALHALQETPELGPETKMMKERAEKL